MDQSLAVKIIVNLLALGSSIHLENFTGFNPSLYRFESSMKFHFAVNLLFL
jgi:hypothetical protein